MTPFRCWIPVLGCACLLAGSWQTAQAQLSINLDDAGGVSLQNGSQPPLVVGPGQSFGGTLTPNGFQGVMSDLQGARQLQPDWQNPFRNVRPMAPAATQPLQINAGGISVSLPGLSAPPAVPRMARTEPMTAAMFASVRQLAREADPTVALRAVDRMLMRYPAQPDLLQLQAVLLMREGRAKEAAACAYDAMSQEECWTWPMLRSCFATRDVVERLYHDLKLEMQDRPTVEQVFLLAWWERMLDHDREAVRAMERAMEMAPRDRLMARLHEEWTTAMETEAPPAAQP